MTTIVTTPFKEGILVVSDTRATNTHTLEIYACTDKTTGNLCSLLPIEMYIAAAGVGGVIQFAIHPLISYIQLTCLQYKIDLNKMSVANFFEFFSSTTSKYFREKRTEIKESLTINNIDLEILESSAIILTVRTKRFLACVNVTLPCGSCFLLRKDTDAKFVHETEQREIEEFHKQSFLHTGSGGRCVMGAIAVQNQRKPWITKTKQESIKWFYKNFQTAISMDNGSGIDSGLNILVVPKDMNVPAINYLLSPQPLKL